MVKLTAIDGILRCKKDDTGTSKKYKIGQNLCLATIKCSYKWGCNSHGTIFPI